MAERQAGKAPTGPVSNDARGPKRKQGSRIKRRELRRAGPGSGVAFLGSVVSQPAALPVALVLVGLSVVIALAAVQGRDLPKLSAGLVSDETVAARVPFRLRNEERTLSRADLRRASAERVYATNEGVLREIEEPLRGLPEAIASVESLSSVSSELREDWSLNEARFTEFKRLLEDPAFLARWNRRVDNFVQDLRERPILPNEQIQQIKASGTGRLLLRGPTFERFVASEDAIDMDSPLELRTAISQLARRASMHGELIDLIVDRLASTPVPTYEYDPQATAELLGDEEAVYDTFELGQVIIARGEQATARQVELVEAERRAFSMATPMARRAASWLAVWVVASGLVIGFWAYLFAYYPRVVTRPWRSFAIAVLVAGAVAGSVAVAGRVPGSMWLGLSLAVMLPTMTLVVAYDRRLALTAAGVMIAGIGFALRLPPVSMLALAGGAVLAVWRLNEIRSRADVVRGTMVVCGGLAVGTFVAGVASRPAGAPGVLEEIGWSVAASAVGAFAAGALLLFLMPTIERVFEVTTGMTLSELRDPKQPLLRMLQQRAPGTYNHSLNVATIAEAAAQSIGADALHLYVGCLYHDIGKINKPAYFVENQPRGLNRHDKLSPAMSLLVIMGHVKDGMELAREYGLPRSLHHYIESHHGETLVTYFYHQARQAAAEGDAEAPSELEYRYPGPKPRTKEAAILMLCDSVEGATRAMSEPTSSRISALVHDIAHQRLVDGQFDECELTFGELERIENAITKALTSIYHGRIAYPSAERRSPKEQPTPPVREASKAAEG